MTGQEDFDAAILAELRLLDPEVRRDATLIRELLHPDFLEFGTSGRIWETDSIIEALTSDQSPRKVIPINLQASSLSNDLVLLTYKIESSERSSLRSSIWVKLEDGRWLLRFHQGTTIAQQ